MQGRERGTNLGQIPKTNDKRTRRVRDPLATLHLPNGLTDLPAALDGIPDAELVVFEHDRVVLVVVVVGLERA
jgi:hypothetical protein